MSDKRLVRPRSREEAQIAESVIYGLLWVLLQATESMITEKFNYYGADVSTTGEDLATGVIYDGLTIHMASGDYRITVERTEAR